jgi:hypothetical protein
METYIGETMEDHLQIPKKEFQKMVFIMNALNQGWKIQKSEESYIFTKKHEGKREIFKSDYLEKFIDSNLPVYTVFPK